jgi:hypothetical protein
MQSAETVLDVHGAEYRGIVQYYLLAGDVYRRTGCTGSW